MPREPDLAIPPVRRCGDGAGARKACVLVVDDESALRSLIVRVLKDEGHTVLEAGDGAQALELLEGEVGGIDLVLTDVKMPRLGGLELGRRIAMRQQPIPIVYMSADPPAAFVGRASGVGTPPCLQKPFSITALVVVVDRLGGASMVDRLLGGASGEHAAVEASLASVRHFRDSATAAAAAMAAMRR
jgi:two-component system, chemotaxis family, chemotaxis protein CheY